MDEEIDLIEQARKAGQRYIDSFAGDLKAACADLQRRSADANRQVVSLPPKSPHPWQFIKPSEKKAG